MSKVTIILIVVLILMIAAIVALYFLGKKAQKQQDEQQQMLDSMKQQCSMLIIDKKKMKLKDAGFPDIVTKSAPKRANLVKMPVVKAKVGPRVMSFMCDEAIFDLIPVGKEVKATVSGIYITGVRGIRGPLEQPKKKKSLMQKLTGK